jgi:ATP-dependent Lon protease
MELNEDLLSEIEFDDVKIEQIPEELNILPLRDVLVFPNVIFPVLIGRNSSIKSVSKAMENKKFIFLSLQKNPDTEEPGFDEINKYGVIARIMQILRLPNNMLKLLVEGLHHAKIEKNIKKGDILFAKVKIIENNYNDNDKRLIALNRKAHKLFSEYLKIDNTLPQEILGIYESMDTSLGKMYYALSNIKTDIDKKQLILNERFLKRQLFIFNEILTREIELLKMEAEIDSKIQESIQKTQRKFYIQEQIRALQNELGEDNDNMPELTVIKELLEKAKLPEHVKEKADEEFDRLKKTPTMSPEFAVNRNYLELLASLPWNKKTNDIYDIEHVKKILDEDHFDLEKPKDRILEFIAVLNLAGSLKRQILCFVGPPGVGKTSLAKSIARAMGREFVRFSLGGVRDEAEIRGHRRTYIGAMPGKIIQSMKKAGTINPVILLDEIDKMAMDFRGDPSSALLEVLDPEQNINFQDHYLEVDYDLSNVMFITTANVKYDIPLPLQDRMEIIELNSYLDPEKLEIAKRHIIPKLLKEYGMDNLNISIEDDAILKIIRE